MRRPLMIGVLVTAAVVLVTSAAVAVGLMEGQSSVGASRGSMMSSNGMGPSGSRSAPDPAPAPSSSSGSLVNVSLTDSGGPMGEGYGPMQPGAMGMNTDRATVPHGNVSFVVANAGAVRHEMVILPLTGSQTVGTRPFGGDAKVDEAGSLGEASKSGGEGSGEGIEPGASGRLTVTLAPGRYELICNLMGHYVSGMYRQLTVT
ncbi:MAG: hypothetical protein ABI662_01175 [Dermatophilaceae bacterium]